MDEIEYPGIPPREKREEDNFLPALAGAASLFLTPKMLEPYGRIPLEMYEKSTADLAIKAPQGTPLEQIAEFTPDEVQKIRGFADRKGVTAAIEAAGPGEGSHFALRGIGDEGVVRLGKSHVPSALHEIGHASPILGSRGLRDTSLIGHSLSRGRPGKLLRAAIGLNLLRDQEDAGELSQFAYENAPALMGATYAPMLLEEARASGHAIAGGKKFGPGAMETAKSMAPAFGTYLTRALAPIIAAIVTKRVVESVRGSKDGHEKEALEQTPRILRASAASAWRMRPPAAKPKTTKPTSSLSANGKEVAKLQPPSNKAYYRDLLESLHNPARGFRST